MNSSLRFKTLVLPVTFAALVAGVIACNSKPKDAASAQDQKTSEKKEAGAQKEIWTCAMHPQIQKDGPGHCPICGMTLVKQEKGDSAPTKESSQNSPAAHAEFSLSKERQQMIGVKTGTTEKKPLFKSIRAAGRLAFDPELYTAQNEYAEALKQLERVKDSPLADVKHSAQRMVQSAKLRLKILGLSDKQIASLGTSAPGESNLLINKPGQSVWVYADIYEMDLPNIQPGQSAEISAGFLGGTKLAGKVASVDRVISPATRTAKARILIQQAAPLLRPESYVDVTIMAPLGVQVTAPFDAILDTGKQSWVFVVGDKNEFSPRLVTIKFQAGDEVAIASGLSGGEKIVTSANFLVDSESRLKAVALGQTDSDKPSKPSVPSCPKGEHWDVPMAMCMPN